MTRTNPTQDPMHDNTSGIISARIARKSRGCNSGFGLCDFKLFPKKRKKNTSSDLVATRANIDYKDLFEVEYDSFSDKFYVNMLLARALPENVDMISMKIDEDIYWVNDAVTRLEIEDFLCQAVDEEVFTKGLLAADSYVVYAGEIPFDASLGEYGGYRISLEKIH